MNNKCVPPQINLQKTLQLFYSTIVPRHHQAEQKMQVLELYLAKINEYQIKKKTKLYKDLWNVQTQASLQDHQESAVKEEKKSKMKENMLYTFLFLHNQKRQLVESGHLTKIKPKVEFSNESLKRVTLYAILVYCLHFTRGDQSSAIPQEAVRHLLRTIKKAHVKAAYSLRESFGRKLYAKTRFLCEKLHENMESAVSSADKVIKIIVEEFHPCFVDQIFALLSQSIHNSMGLQSLCSPNHTPQISLLNLDNHSERSDETLKAALENLNMNLTVRCGQKSEQIGKRCNINVVIEEDTEKRYYLTEIDLFREWYDVSSIRN